MRFKEYSFLELLSAITDNRGKTVPTAEKGIPLIATNCIKNETLYPSYDKVRYVSQEIYDTWFRGHPQPGDMIFTCKGTPGRVCWVPNPIDFCIAQDMVGIRANEDIVYPKYLFALLRSVETQNKILNMHVGTLIPHFKKGDFGNLYFDIPTDMEYQKIVGDSYFDFCLKIEANRQTNQTLEQIAQAIFKSWFIDFEPTHAKIIAKDQGANLATQELAAQAIICGAFTLEQLAEVEQNLETTLQQAIDEKLNQHNQTNPTALNAQQLKTTAALFPNELVESELGDVPVGWRYMEASEVAEVAIGKTPPRKESHWFSADDNDVRWVSIKDLGESGAYILDTSEYLTEEAVSQFNVRRIPHDTVLLSFKMTVGRVAITDGEMLSNEAIAHFKLIDDYSIPTEYLFLFLKNFNYQSLGSTSSIVTAVNSKIIRGMPILVPSADILNKYKDYVSPLFQQIKNLLLETQSLVELRDTLLPKLLSGELDVSALADNAEAGA